MNPKPRHQPPGSPLLRFKNHLRRRFLLGIVVFAPFGLTIWILVKFVTFSKDVLTKPIVGFLDKMLENQTSKEVVGIFFDSEKGEYLLWVQYSSLFISIVITLVILYTIGLLSSTFFGRRYIAMGERLLRRIPGVQFCYGTIKQVIEILSRPQTQAFQKVVVIEYPRKGIRGLAFFSGITVVPKSGEVMINVFIPTTPNPTSGFLLLMRPDEVLETNLTVAEATRFIISGGVVPMDNLEVRPFSLEDYEEDIQRRIAVNSTDEESTAEPMPEAT